MAEAVTRVSGVAERYASALFELARDEGQLDAVSADLAAFSALLQESSDLTRLVRSPVYTSDDQLRGVGAVLDKSGSTGLAANLIRLAARNRRLFVVPDMITAFGQMLARHRGEISASVTSAEPLSAGNVAALKAALKDATGKDVMLEQKVDPSLIGGLVVQLGSRMIDTSLKTKLNSLKFAMKEAG